MTEKTCKVGDVVAWADVPDGALVRECLTGHFALRVGDQGRWVQVGEHPWRRWQPMWLWNPRNDGDSIIVALGLTGQETAADLQRLAEVFEVRQALFVAESRGFLCVVAGAGTPSPLILAEGDDIGAVAERLHAAGWRPGMTAEDAARLLREGTC